MRKKNDDGKINKEEINNWKEKRAEAVRNCRQGQMSEDWSGCTGLPGNGAHGSQWLSATLILSSSQLAASVGSGHMFITSLNHINTDPKSQWKQGNHQIASKRNICSDLLLTPESLMDTHPCLCCHPGKWIPARLQSLVLALLPPFFINHFERK